MAYNRENTRRIRREYEGKHLLAAEDAERRAAALRREIPALAELDARLAETGMRIYAASIKYTGAALDAEIARLRTENEALQAERAALLLSFGYPADATDPRYECPICKDTGVDQMKMCRCMREKLTLAGFASSGIAHLMKTQSFDTFSPTLQGANQAECEKLLRRIRRYADGFSADPSGNLLLYGGTGLGKTHLSTAIAKSVIEQGFDVVYVTAQDLLADFESARFDRSARPDDAPNPTDRYTDCDLLIIDDLGTEMSNAFTLSVLYNLLNARINQARATVISTNLSPDDLRTRYSDRIASRLFGTFLPIRFVGEDIRMKKILSPK